MNWVSWLFWGAIVLLVVVLAYWPESDDYTGGDDGL